MKSEDGPIFYRRLALKVLALALDDARASRLSSVSTAWVEEARKWLLTDWEQESLKLWCDVAGVNYGLLREAAVEKIRESDLAGMPGNAGQVLMVLINGPKTAREVAIAVCSSDKKDLVIRYSRVLNRLRKRGHVIRKGPLSRPVYCLAKEEK